MQIVDWVFGYVLDASDERMVASHAIPRTCWRKWMSDLIQEQVVQKVLLSRYCRRRHRRLRTEKAMHLGYGKVCAKKILDALQQRGSS